MSSSKSEQSSSEFERSISNLASENSPVISASMKVESSKRELMIEEIEQRLRVVEDQDKVMKETLLIELEERRKLMNEIHKQFQQIENSNSEPLSIKHLKETSASAGLVQVLWQGSNPLLVTRDVTTQGKARAVAQITSSSSQDYGQDEYRFKPYNFNLE